MFMTRKEREQETARVLYRFLESILGSTDGYGVLSKLQSLQSSLSHLSSDKHAPEWLDPEHLALTAESVAVCIVRLGSLAKKIDKNLYQGDVRP